MIPHLVGIPVGHYVSIRAWCSVGAPARGRRRRRWPRFRKPRRARFRCWLRRSVRRRRRIARPRGRRDRGFDRL